MASYSFWLPVLLGSLSLLGCGSLPPDTRNTPQSAVSQQLPLAQAELELSSKQRQTRINKLLEQSLKPDQAVELLLLNSPQVRAELAELGIAEAQQVQAGLLSNPRFALGALRPEGGGRWQLDAGISQSILDIFTRPLRKQLAATEFTAAQIKLHLKLNQQIYQVQHQYYKTLAASELAQLNAAHHQAAEANLSLAQSLFNAGNIPERHLLQYQLETQARMRQQQEANVNVRQEQIALAALLGLDSDKVIKLPNQLPPLPSADNFSSAGLFAIAKQNRSDLQLARTQVRTAENMLALQHKTGAFTELELGANVERETDGSYKAGPEIAFSLPVFDRGHARLQSAEAAVQYATALLQAQEIQTEAEITRALMALNSARVSIEQIEQTSLPLQRKVQALKLREYNFMLSSAFELMQLKQQEFDLLRERTNALLAYWQTRSELALASGQSLAPDTEFQSPPEQAEPAKPDSEIIPPEKPAPEIDHSMHNHGDHYHD